MDDDKRSKIVDYLRAQITQGEERLRDLTVDVNGNKLPQRSAYLVLDRFIRRFMGGSIEPRWIAVPGLRGSGKTTILAQLYTNLKWKRGYKLYLSLDDLLSLGVSLSETLQVYQELLGTNFNSLNTPIFLFLDEVQYDKNWGLTLKTVFDKSRKVFILSTGSSALSLQANPDIARRVTYAKLFPLSFVEYILIKKKNVYPVRELGKKIREAIFESKNANEVFDKLKKLEPEIYSYTTNYDKGEINDYLKFGTLPFTLHLPNEALIYARINQTLGNVITKDLPQLNQFDTTTIEKIPQILYAIANSEKVSILSISRMAGLDSKTIASVFNALEKTEVLQRIYPYGSHTAQVRKASKYLFTSPAYRAMYFNLTRSQEAFDSYKGKLLEDIVGMYFSRIFTDTVEKNITYDSAKGGADFILGMGQSKNKIAVEVGFGKKSHKQARKTMLKTKAKYGLTISDASLKLSAVDGLECILLPTETFLLM